MEGPNNLRDLRIVGLHPVQPSTDEIGEAVEILWGSELSGSKLEAARRDVREHFSGPFLLEVEIQPPNAEFDWSDITQVVDGQPRSNWQVPYDEQPVDREAGRWAFFLHFVDLKKALSTPLGELSLPEPTACPQHLESIKYEVP
jgi:hypothetical protein